MADFKAHYFKDDHGRTLRVVVTANGHVELGLIDRGSGDVVYLPQDHAPPKESGIENCSGLSVMQEIATVCPLHADNVQKLAQHKELLETAPMPSVATH